MSTLKEQGKHFMGLYLCCCTPARAPYTTYPIIKSASCSLKQPGKAWNAQMGKPQMDILA
jgi:hypothetical protein